MTDTITIQMNGREVDLADGSTVADAAALVGVTPDDRGVAVALGGTVVPRGAWAATAIDEGDRVEIVRAAAGG